VWYCYRSVSIAKEHAINFELFFVFENYIFIPSIGCKNGSAICARVTGYYNEYQVFLVSGGVPSTAFMDHRFQELKDN
jgi:hypothetical protein